MYESIAFYIGNKHLGLYGNEYVLGELTTELLNLPRDKYTKMRKTLEYAQLCMKQYEQTHDFEHWFQANETFIRLDRMMCQHRIFRLLKADSDVFDDAREVTCQYSLFEDEDYELQEHDLEVLSRISDYEDYLEHPENYGGENSTTLRSLADGKSFDVVTPQPEIPPVPPPKTRALLVCPGNLELKWAYYKQHCAVYESVLLDVDSLHYTIKNFNHFILSKLKTLNANNYVEALSFFISDERLREKLVANPINRAGNYTMNDVVRMHHIPRETFPGSGIFKVYEFYEVSTLQAMIKLDFYKGLEAGHLIRKCECCDRFFLLQKGYHTKYCDTPNPKNPKYTCAQIGYRMKGIKETASDDPMTQSLRRCYQRIDKDLSRRNITKQESDLLYAKAKDLYHEARLAPGISYEEFEQSLASENLYALCGVTRKTRPRGRPKKEI